jgi:broad specificity polyphosphatase/5'/3'-nucleotidase SurE
MYWQCTYKPTPVIGQVYYNSGDSSLYVCTVGGATPTWVVVGTEGTATSSALGSIKLFSDTEQSVAATSVSATAARTYGVQLNSDSRAVVNVPWTNTTYGIATDTTPGLIELFNNTDQSVSR